MFIAHRVNSSSHAENIRSIYGIEFDIRDSNGIIIVTHDPFTNGENFEVFLSKLSKRFLIVNIKSEGIEEQALELLKKYGFEDFFFLDCTFPAIIKLFKKGEKRNALRFSEYENITHIFENKDKIQWVWVDCFTYFPLTKKIEELIHAHGLKICIVSPELQGQPEYIDKYRKYINDNNLVIDAICTKEYNIDLWESI